METISGWLLTFLINSVWQIPVVAAVAALACRAMRNGPAAHRNIIWAGALLLALVLPLAGIRPLAPEPAPVAMNAPAVSYAAPAPLAPAPPAETRGLSFTPNIATLLLGAYAAFLLIRCVRLARAWLRTARIRRSSTAACAPPLVEGVLARCAQAFGLDGVELLVSPDISSPLTAGLIILPGSMFQESSEDVLTTAIGHEMAHIARHDFAMNLLCELLYLPLSFHPAAWIIRRRIERTREMACDEAVTRLLVSRQAYAHSLVSIAAAASALPRPSYMLGVFDGDVLEERVRRLVERPAANWKRARLALAAGLSALVLSAATASHFAMAAQTQSSEPAPNDKTALYKAGMADWAAVYPELQKARRAAGLPDGAYVTDARLRAELRERFLPRIQHGQMMLQMALAIDPNYSDALSYMNLLTRMEAMLADSPAQSAALESKADVLLHQALRNAPPKSAPAHLPPPPPPPPPPPAMRDMANHPVSNDPMSPGPLLYIPGAGHRLAVETGAYWQVGGPDGITAGELVRQLKNQGISARMIGAARATGVQVAVFAGPYVDEQSLAQARVAIEIAGFRALRRW
jgi:beta-lactamase regulating signal transducer with metallopeptidase domain